MAVAVASELAGTPNIGFEFDSHDPSRFVTLTTGTGTANQIT
jgi:hypothetical protein